MRYGSVCSGIESASVAWEPLGWSAAWFSEIEPFPSAVLAHRWPSVANLGDMTQLSTLIAAGLIEAPDVFVGGTPCQAFSVAGMRKGLDDERGQLTIKYVEVANEIDKQRPKGEECVAVWENVPGVLSSKDNAFGCFLAALVGEDDPLEPAGKKWGNAGIVYGPQRVAAWRVLDAQYFGVAQRRRRVFVVASARDGFDPGAVLFESESLRRDTPPSREARSLVAALTANGVGTCGADDNQGQAGHLIPLAFQSKASHTNSMNPSAISPTLDVGKSDGVAVALPIHDKATRYKGGGARQEDGVQRNDGSGNGFGIGGPDDPCYTITSGDKHAVAFQQNASGEVRTGEQAYTLNTNSNASGRNTGMIQAGTTVRRLTPKECERLQGFPDNHTFIPWKLYQECKRKGWSYEGELIKRGLRLKGSTVEDCPDGPRYKAIGNSKAVPVIRWVGERIKKHLEEAAANE